MEALAVKSVPEISIYVRFFETDAAGHVNNISYYIYLEEARTKFLEYCEIDKLRKTFKQKLHFMIASSKCNYYKQVYAKQNLKLNSKITRIGTKSFTLEHDIMDAETGDMVATGGAVMVCFNLETQKSVEIPPSILSVLEKHLIVNEYDSIK
jgi:acyl-CoA thioester hydrolase